MNTGIRHIATRDMVLCAVMAAVTAVCAQISIPMPSGVPVTLQTFAVPLTGYLLGMKYGLISVAVYILLGAAGVPVFTGFRGGIGTIAGPTGGFIVGFLLMVIGFMCMQRALVHSVGKKYRELTSMMKANMKRMREAKASK